MHAQQILDDYLASAMRVTPNLENALGKPALRLDWYKQLLLRELKPYAALIRAAFEAEVAYRNALWDDALDDDGIYFENIYRCAFLLYCLADPSDIWRLWRAKFINMDVGTTLGAEFFVGYGVEEALAFLENLSSPESDEIHGYVAAWFAHPEARMWQKKWERDMREEIANAEV